MRYQQGTYGLSQDLRDCRKNSMQLSRDISRWKGIAQLFYAAHHEQNNDMAMMAVEAYDAACEQ